MEADQHPALPSQQIAIAAQTCAQVSALLRAPFERTASTAAAATQQRSEDVWAAKRPLTGRDEQVGLAVSMATRAWLPLFAPDGLNLPLAQCIHVWQRFDFQCELAPEHSYLATPIVRRIRRRSSHDVVEVTICIESGGRLYCQADSVLWKFHRHRSNASNLAGNAVDADPSQTHSAGAASGVEASSVESNSVESSSVEPSNVGSSSGESVSVQPSSAVPSSAQSSNAQSSAFEPNRAALLLSADLRSYAELSTDDNPIHLQRSAAQRLGFPEVIAPGMLVFAIGLQRVVDLHPGAQLAAAQAGFSAALPVAAQGARLEFSSAPISSSAAEFQLSYARQPLLSRVRVDFAA